MPETLRCGGCGWEVAPDFLSCPSCRRLVHAERLKALSAEAERAEGDGRAGDALRLWREALALLPADSRQHAAVGGRIDLLGPRAGPEAAPAPARRGSWAAVAGLGAAALFVWKFKFILGFLLTKGKLLLLGLTKMSTLLSMLLSFGAYWTVWGWAFALGLLVSIYIHEIGHVSALRRYGIPASAPMFIPGFGAFIRAGAYPMTPREDCRVGLAGPVWGLGAAVAAALLSFAADWPLGAALARTGAWINLFNLLPAWSLDGGRGFRSLTRAQRGWAAAGVAVAWFVSEESLLVLLLLAALWQTLAVPAAATPDRGGLALYLFLIGALAALTRLPVPV